MKINRHTIDSDIKYWYTILTKDWERGTAESWFMKQTYRLEEKRARLLAKLEKSDDEHFLPIERELKDIDYKIFNMFSKTAFTRDNMMNQATILINQKCEQNAIPAGFVRWFDFIRVSNHAKKKIQDIIVEDKKTNPDTWS